MTFECDERAEKFHSDHAYHHYHPDLGSISDTVVETNFQPIRSRGGGYCHVWAIYVCAAVKGMVFKQLTLG